MKNETKKTNLEIQEINNRVIIDLMIKTNKTISLLNMLLDANNYVGSTIDNELLSGKDYSKVQDCILDANSVLQEIYINFIKEQQKKGKNENKNN